MKLRRSQIETLEAVAAHELPGVTTYRLSRVLGVSSSGARSRLKRLEAAGLVHEPGWLRYYRLTEAGKQALSEEGTE